MLPKKYLKHFKSCEEFSCFFCTPMDLKPFQTGSFVVFFLENCIWLSNCPPQELGFTNLDQELGNETRVLRDSNKKRDPNI